MVAVGSMDPQRNPSLLAPLPRTMSIVWHLEEIQSPVAGRKYVAGSQVEVDCLTSTQELAWRKPTAN
jgi:hypothetical protein